MPLHNPIRILHLEDNARDAELIRDHLEAGGIECDIRYASTKDDFLQALSSPIDLCLLDYGIAGYGGQAALKALHERHLGVPVIVVTGILGEDAAVEWLHWGATDYVLKQRPAKLIPAVKRALAEAEESRQRRQAELELQQAQTAAKIGTWAFDIAEQRFRCSDEVCRIWGLSFGPSLKLDGSIARVHPDDRDRVQRAWSAAFEGVKPYELVYRIEVEGTQKWIFARADIVHDSSGRAERVVGLTQDITEREQDRHALIESENALRELNANLETTVRTRTSALEMANALLANKQEEIRSVLDNLLSCVISIDARGTIQWANQAVEEILGYSVSEVLGKNVSMLMPPLQANKHDEYLMHYLNTGEAKIIGIGREVQGLHKDGTHIPLDLSISEYFLDTERHYTGILRDNRERNRILRDLKAARDDALQASRAKSDFLAVMSHEIRTPMNGVIGMLDVLQLSSLKAEQQEMINLIHESAHSLMNVINDILDYSKIEAGRMELEQDVVDLEGLLESVCAMMDRMALTAGVELTYFVDPHISKSFFGDGARLRQVLVNLVGNAIKFSGSRDRVGRVNVNVHPNAPTQEVLLFEIVDNGIGMDEKTLASLFTPFTQADLSTTRRFGGTGLGLAISQHLVELMGGEISVQSRIGAGSTFSIHLPTGEALPAGCCGNDELANLTCAVLGTNDSLAEALTCYLTASRATVQLERGDHLEDVLSRQGRFDLIVCDLKHKSVFSASQLDRLQQALQLADTGLLLIERGRRRTTRRLGAHIYSLDGNCLSRRRFLDAAAEAAGKGGVKDGTSNEPPEKKPPVLSRQELTNRGCLILVAEDNTINQRVIITQLEALGFAADVATDGREALSRWRTRSYSLLFTDLHMPDMDGYELARAIRAAELPGARTPIVALTANALKGESDKCREAGMDDYLTKPLPLDTLRAALARWLPAMEKQGGPAPKARPSVATPGAAIELSTLRELMGGNEGAAMEILKDFMPQSARGVKELRSAIELADCERAAEFAHKLKSSSRALGAVELGQICEKLEAQAKANNATLLKETLTAFDRALDEVDLFIQRL